MATSTIKEEFGATKSSISVTAGTGVTIDTNKSYRIGKAGILAVKGHTTQALTASSILFTFANNSNIAVGGVTVPIGIGAAWDITDTAYGYLSYSGFSSGALPSGTYFHVYIPILFAS